MNKKLVPRLWRPFLFLVLLGVFYGTALAEDFYQDKTIRFVLGFSAGGGYDTYTRAIARHMGKHIPGNPTIVVENMTGAGSLIAANFVYNRAEPDGLTVGIWSSTLVLRQALGEKTIRFDARKLQWIGTPTKDTPACAVMAFTGMRTLEDVLNAKRPLNVGSTGSGTTFGLPTILNQVLGKKFELITGYKGTSKIRVALQAHEMEGICYTWESMRTTGRSLLDAQGGDELIPFIIHRRFDDPEVKDLPLVTDVIKGEKNLAIYNAWVATYEFFRPFSVPPETPKKRVQILRSAFKATLDDPEFLSEMKKANLPTVYVSPGEIEGHVKDIFSISPETKKALKFLIPSGKKKK